MEQFILQLGIMSLQAAVVIVAVLVVRAVFNVLHVPKKYITILWILPFIVMIFPWRIESSFSFWREPAGYQLQRVQGIISQMQDLSSEEGQAPEEHQAGAEQTVNQVKEDEGVNDVGLVAGFAELMKYSGGSVTAWTGIDGPADLDTAAESDSQIMTGSDDGLTETVRVFLRVAGGIWISGVAILLIYSILSYRKLCKKILCSINVSDNIYRADDVDTPFVLGVLQPKIYLPSNIQEDNLPYVLEHEKTHIRRKDPIKKILAFAIAGIHWFNPFAWVAFFFFGRDMEMACDEETIAGLGMEKKQDYATALLQLSTGKSMNLASHLAFGEGDVKSRIKNVIKYRQALKIVSVAAGVVIVVLTVGFLTKYTSTTTLAQIDDNIVGISQNSSPREIHLIMNDQTTNFPEAYFDIFMDFFRELEVEKEPISLSRAEDRAMDVQLEVGENTYIYLNADYTEIWSNNGVKPSFSYRVKDPQAVIDFLHMQVGSMSLAEQEHGETEKENQDTITSEDMIIEEEHYPELLDEKLICAMNRLFVYTGIDVSEEVFQDMIQSDIDTPMMGKLVSSVEAGEQPTEDMQSNFGYVGADIVFYSSGTAVDMDGKWIYFAPADLLNIYDLQEYRLLYVRRNFSEEFEKLIVQNQETGEVLASYPEGAGLDTEKYRIGTIDNLMGYGTCFYFYDASTEWFPYGYYYTVKEGMLKCLGKTWGYDESQAYVVDVNKDGTTELICNTQYGDGVYQAMVYYRQGSRVLAGDGSSLLDEAFDNVSFASLNSKYLPEENVIQIDYWKEDISGYKKKKFEIDLSKMTSEILEPASD